MRFHTKKIPISALVVLFWAMRWRSSKESQSFSRSSMAWVVILLLCLLRAYQPHCIARHHLASKLIGPRNRCLLFRTKHFSGKKVILTIDYTLSEYGLMGLCYIIKIQKERQRVFSYLFHCQGTFYFCIQYLGSRRATCRSLDSLFCFIWALPSYRYDWDVGELSMQPAPKTSFSISFSRSNCSC
jgi:hypothetical protein